MCPLHPHFFYFGIGLIVLIGIVYSLAKDRLEASQMKNFIKHSFAVYIRDKNGEKSSFEDALIGRLLDLGATAELLLENDGKAVVNDDTSVLKDGFLAFIGTSSQDGDCTQCNYRLLVDDKGKIKIINAGCDEGYSQKDLAERIVGYLVSAIWSRDKTQSG